jgi:hypothetical protein
LLISRVQRGAVPDREPPARRDPAAGGAGLTVLAISVNGGLMPASAGARRIAGIAALDGFANSAAVAHPQLLWLGDVIPVPGPWPIGNVLSVGDLLIFAGALHLLHRTCGSRLALGHQPTPADS